MQRHILDTTRLVRSPRRLALYLGADLAERPSNATLLLQRRARKGPMRQHLKQFLRVERGHMA